MDINGAYTHFLVGILLR